jgi:hypothetical protein
VEIRILKKIFSPEEASMASQLTGSMESVEVIAQHVGLSPEKAKARWWRWRSEDLHGPIEKMMSHSSGWHLLSWVSTNRSGKLWITSLPT